MWIYEVNPKLTVEYKMYINTPINCKYLTSKPQTGWWGTVVSPYCSKLLMFLAGTTCQGCKDKQVGAMAPRFLFDCCECPEPRPATKVLSMEEVGELYDKVYQHKMSLLGLYRAIYGGEE